MAEQVLAEHETGPAVYYRVLAALLVLTVATVLVSLLNIPGVWHIVLGLIIATCKGSLVVLFFMHVLHSKPLTWVVVGFIVFWLGILLVLTLSDYFSRGLLGFPGH